MTQAHTEIGDDFAVANFAMVNGVLDCAKMHYQRTGSGRPLLLIHGLVGSAKNWRQNIGSLSRDSCVYAVDLLNMGESERVPELDAGLEATADRLAALMDAIGVAEADVAGHSYGGAVAMMLAARHPARVRRLILFAPANPFCTKGHGLIRFYQSLPGRCVARLIPFLPRRFKAAALDQMYGDPSRIAPGTLCEYIDDLRVRGTMSHILRIIEHWFEDMERLRSALPGLAGKSVLLIWGDRDLAVSLDSAREMQQALPQSNLLILPGAGHIAFAEMPEACNRAMRDWLLNSSPPELRS